MGFPTGAGSQSTDKNGLQAKFTLCQASRLFIGLQIARTGSLTRGWLQSRPVRLNENPSCPRRTCPRESGIDVPINVNLIVRRQIRFQGAFTTDNDATEIAMRAIESTKFPVQDMVTHKFSLEKTEKCIRAVGGEIPGLYPVKALIRP